MKKIFTVLLAGILILYMASAGIAATTTATTERISVSSTGVQGENTSREPSISADGRYVAFVSQSKNLVDGSLGWESVFVHDRQLHETTLVSVSTTGTIGNGDGETPSISADGRYVAFVSWASNLVDGDTNRSQDVFVHDRETGETKRVSVSSAGLQGSYHSTRPSISADGRFVVFESISNNLVDGDNNGSWDIFVHDQLTGETTRVSVSSTGSQGVGHSSYPTISGDGRYVAFHSSASNLVDGEDGVPDIYVHDRQTGKTSRISVSNVGIQGNDSSWDPSISADGRYIAFSSWASNLVDGDTNGQPDIFVHDRLTAKTTRVSITSSGAEGDGTSSNPSISADGRYVAFDSRTRYLAKNDYTWNSDVYVHNLITGETTMVSVPTTGVQEYADSYDPAINANGHYLVFSSDASNLVDGDTNRVTDVFVRRLGVVDSISPATITNLKGTLGQNNWHTSDVQLTFTATDNEGGSGVAKTEYSFDGTSWTIYTAPFIVSTEGTTKVYYRSTDNAGNIESTKEQLIKIDKTPPAISGAATTTPNANGWYNSDVTIHFTASDSVSGIDTVTPDITISTEGTDQSVTGTATDQAGNSASFIASGINIDKSAPEVSLNSLQEKYFYGDKLILDFAASDSISGITSVTSTLDGKTVQNGTVVDLNAPGLHEMEVAVQDKAGNVTVKRKTFEVVLKATVTFKPNPIELDDEEDSSKDNKDKKDKDKKDKDKKDKDKKDDSEEPEWVKAYIELPAGFDVTKIDIGSVRLNGRIPAAIKGEADDEDDEKDNKNKIKDKNHNGIPELEVRFDKAQVIELLDLNQPVELTVSGSFAGQYKFEGFATVKLVSDEDD